MFRAPVMNTPFVGQYADVFFPNISGDFFQGDVSFLTTLRALLAPHIKKEDEIRLRFSQTSPFKASNIGDKSEFFSDKIDIGLDKGELRVHSLRGDTDANAKAVEIIREEYLKAHKGYREVTAVAEFFKNMFSCVCFTNEKAKACVIFVSRLNMRSMHYLQAAIPVVLPWVIGKVTKDTFDADGWALIDRLTMLEKEENGIIVNNGADEYVEIINRMAAKYDFEKARIKSMIGDFEVRAQKHELDNLKEQIGVYDSTINSYQNRIMNEIKSRNDTLIRIWGLEHKIETLEGESELLDYFLNNKSLYLESVEGDRISFAVGTYLTYVDPAALESVMKNERSSVNVGATSTISKDDMKMLLRACLIDAHIRMRICAAYSISLSGGVNPLPHHSFSDRFDTYMRNAHVDGANCLGNYIMPITNALRNGNFVGAIEQCIASAMSQNVLESPTFNSLIFHIYDRTYDYRKCFELPDGKVVSPEDAIKWLKEQEAEKGGKENQTTKKAKSSKTKEAGSDE